MLRDESWRFAEVDDAHFMDTNVPVARGGELGRMTVHVTGRSHARKGSLGEDALDLRTRSYWWEFGFQESSGGLGSMKGIQ